MPQPPDPPVGVILSNMGTPKAPTAGAVRAYLGEFLSDPDVVRVPRLPWWFILHGYILRVRPKKVAKLYRRIWTPGGSPLWAVSMRQAAALQQEVRKVTGRNVFVEIGMRYGAPTLETALRALKAKGCRPLVLLPMYPQFSRATTGSTLKMFERRARRHFPESSLRIVEQYHDDPHYILALAESVREAWALDGRPEKLLVSFHGLPEHSIQEGDPYYEQCGETGRRLASELGLEEEDWTMAFQSRFGPADWLKPYTDTVLKEWASEGVRSVHAVCPGFPADCLETLHEVAVEYKDLFLSSGGKEFHYVQALNDRPDHIAALAGIVKTVITQ